MFAGHSTAGVSTASPRNGELQAGLLFSDDAIAPRAMDEYPKYSLGIPVRSKSPLESWDAFSRAWICDFRQVELYSDGRGSRMGK